MVQWSNGPAFEYSVRTRVVAHGAMLAVPFQQADPILGGHDLRCLSDGNLQVYLESLKKT
jgi:hypothetical protein